MAPNSRYGPTWLAWTWSRFGVIPDLVALAKPLRAQLRGDGEGLTG